MMQSPYTSCIDINFQILQVDLLKDQVEEVEEQNSLIMKELRAKTHDYELLKRDHAESQRALQLLQQVLYYNLSAVSSYF